MLMASHAKVNISLVYEFCICLTSQVLLSCGDFHVLLCLQIVKNKFLHIHHILF
jgi:hypothetical protein